MTEIKNNLNRIWNSLEQKAPQLISLFQPGLKREEIDEITKDLPFKLPKEVYELYQWRNGLLGSVELELGLINRPEVSFEPIEIALKYINKIIIHRNTYYFLVIFCLNNGEYAHYYTVPLGQDITPIISLYNDDYFIEYFDFEREFVNKNYTSIQLKLDTDDLSIDLQEQSSLDVEDDNSNIYKSRKKYNCLEDLVAEIAECCEQGFDILQKNEYGFLSVYLNKIKCTWIHYRYRFAKKNIYCLTLEQENELIQTKQRWLNVIHTPLNNEKAATAIQELYTYAGEEIPDIVFVPSFYTAHLGFFGKSDFLKQTQNHSLAATLKSLYWDFLLLPFDYFFAQPVITSTLTSLKSQMSDVLASCLEDDLMYSFEEFLEREISSSSEIGLNSLNYALKSDLKNALENKYIAGYLQYKYILSNKEFVASAALFEFAHLLGVDFDKQKLNLFISYCREVWCLIPFDKIVLVCEKPKIVWSKSNTQYAIEQPDISFSDGYRV